MTRPILTGELRAHAAYMLEKFRDAALPKIDERVSALVLLGYEEQAVDWRAIGEEIAALLHTDDSPSIH